MNLKNIHLLNFKSHNNSKWEFVNNVNCFVGDNGVGKTNILDAIHYLSLTKSYFSSSDVDNINFNSDYFTIKGTFKKEDTFSNIVCNFKQGSNKMLMNNNKKYKRLSDHIGNFPVIFISPTDINLINQGSDIRRRYIDKGVSQFNDSYLKDIIYYNKLLKQRNAFLKNYRITNFLDDISLESINESISKKNKVIYNQRKEYINNLIPIFQKHYSNISRNEEQVDIQYKSHLNNGDFLQLLNSNLAKDKETGFTNIGIHKDDLIFNLNGYPIKKHGSQGQQKSFLIALKLSQFEFIKTHKNLEPIILLDDIFDKLDNHRINHLISLIKKRVFNQVFITDTNKERSEKVLERINTKYSIFDIKN